MNQKRKSGLQRGLADIVEKQTAPVENKSQLSRGLIDKFAPPKDTLSTLSTDSTQRTLSTHPAPVRDYQKVANSITRDAVPAGVFKGKCKQIYDFLYSKTRGAIVPTRNVKLTRQVIMKGAGVGSTKTLFLNLRHLRDSGLVSWKECDGTHEGNEYTVYLPEETLGTQGTQGTQSATSYKLPSVPSVESAQSTHSLTADVKEGYDTPKTSFKTNTERSDDDEPAALALLAPIRRAVKASTGRELTAADEKGLRELGEILAVEFRIAAARTTVNSPGAFIATHMRRRLFKKNEAEMAAEETTGDMGAPGIQKLSAEEIAKCLDCGGSGRFYPGGNNPDGWAKGIAKCNHQSLSQTADESST
jgi:hypothetical protein